MKKARSIIPLACIWPIWKRSSPHRIILNAAIPGDIQRAWWMAPTFPDHLSSGSIPAKNWCKVWNVGLGIYPFHDKCRIRAITHLPWSCEQIPSSRLVGIHCFLPWMMWRKLSWTREILLWRRPLEKIGRYVLLLVSESLLPLSSSRRWSMPRISQNTSHRGPQD